MNPINKKDNLKRRILLVEGNHINLLIMSRLLQGMNVEVVEAKNGEEALKFAIEEDFSMIFMCGFMPEITGYNTTKKIRNHSVKNKDIPIIAVSSNSNNVLTDKMKDYGISDIVSKPLLKDDVESLFLRYSIDNNPFYKRSSTVYKIFNVKEFESFYDDEGLKKEIINTFIAERDNDIKRIDEAFKTKNIDNIYSALHYMKGSFIYLKSQSLVTFTQNLLNLLKAKKLDEVMLLEKTFYKKYDLLFTELNLYIKNK